LYRTATGCVVTNLIIGNNALAVDAAGAEAERLGYSHAMVSATQPEGPVEEIGRHLADLAAVMRDAPGPDCLISGGEGTVRLVGERERGMGGRNQQLALAALIRLAEHDPRGIALVSAGTDGEDGPTDAAGALVDEAVIAEARRRNLDAADFLRRNDAYHFFQPLGALLKTGPTHTNVCDLRVVAVNQRGN
jgi:glycerate-2-kinase